MMQHSRYFFTKVTPKAKKQSSASTGTDRRLDDLGVSLLTVGHHSPDIPTRGKRGTVPFQAGEDICPQHTQFINPICYTQGDAAHTSSLSCPLQNKQAASM